MLSPRAEIATRSTLQRPGMSLPLICELGINTFDRARCNAKQLLQQPSRHLSSRQSRREPRFYSNRVPFERSNRTDAWVDRVGSTSQHQHLLV